MRFKYILAIMLFSVLFFCQESFAQFGKNIVQYQKYDWKFIQSKHFDVYFHDDTKYLAEFTAISAEAALQSIQNTLNYRINKRVSIIVYNSHNQFQQTNVINQFMPEGVGGVTELFKNRVVVPFQGDYKQFKHVIQNELVHAVMNDMFYGGSIQSALTTVNVTQIPIWMSEGRDEWESLQGLDT